MVNRKCFGKNNLLSKQIKAKVMASIILLAMTMTACSQESSVVKNGKMTTEENTDSVENEEEKSSEIDENKIELSMEEAIALGMEEASKYYENLLLTEVHSFDNDQNPDTGSGEDGRREWWYVNFANKEQNYVSILIADGEILNVEHFDSNGNTGLIDTADIQLTADEAVKKAQDMGLKGGDPKNESDWVSGYNFKMSYASLIDSPDESRIFLEVIGISPNGNFAHVDFDAATGEVLLAEEKIEYENEEIEWKKF